MNIIPYQANYRKGVLKLFRKYGVNMFDKSEIDFMDQDLLQNH